MKKRSAYLTILLTLLCCSAMALVDGVLRPGYGIKSAVKLTLFLGVLFLLAMAGLAAGGCIFNWLNEKTGSVYCSWLIHMFANFAINTVGFLLL